MMAPRRSSVYGLRLLSLLLATGLLNSCAVQRGPVFVKDGKSYGVTADHTWRDRWWDYYQRGLSYAEGAFWPWAIADLQMAITQRATDQRYARLYGQRFLEDYFPHRELGIVYYHQGRYAEAAQELETSLHMTESAKAKFYLNKVRRAWLTQRGQDSTAPRVVLSSPLDGTWSNRLTTTLTGTALADSYVAAVTVQSQALFVELAEPRVSFSQDIPLHDGINRVEVIATDLLGRQAQQSLTVFVDRQSPLLSLERLVRTGEPPQQRVRLQGFVTDHSPIRRFTLAGRSIPVPAAAELDFQEEFFLAEDTAALPFEIEDAAGNVTTGTLALTPSDSPPPPIRKGSLPPLPPRARTARASSPLPVRLAALPAPKTMVDLPWTLAQAEPDAPRIRLTAPNSQELLYHTEVYIGGEITAASPIVAVTLHDTTSTYDVLRRRRPTQRLFFGVLVPLQVGENQLRLVVHDAMGRMRQQDLVVTRYEQPVMRLESRLRLAILPFDKASPASELGDSVHDQLLAAFVQQKRFRLLERQRLDDLVREQQLGQTRLVDSKTAVKIGKLAQAEAMVVGTITQKTAHTLEAIAYVDDVETGERLASADVYGENLTLYDVKALMHGLAWKFHQQFPLVHGTVLERQGGHVLMDHGTPPGPLRQHRKMLLYREQTIRAPAATGQSVGIRTEALGEARIESMTDIYVKAALLQSARMHEIRQADKFITK